MGNDNQSVDSIRREWVEQVVIQTSHPYTQSMITFDTQQSCKGQISQPIIKFIEPMHGQRLISLFS